MQQSWYIGLLGIQLGIWRGSLGKDAEGECLSIRPPRPVRVIANLPGSHAELSSFLEALAGA